MLSGTTRPLPLLLSLFAICTLASEANKPNVVIFFTDDQGTLDASCYGSTDLITPNIDELATTGVRFTQAYAHTVLDLCGIAPQTDGPRFDGHSLLPIIESADADSDYGGVLQFAWGIGWAVRDGNWKLIGRGNRNSNEVRTTLHNLVDAEPEAKNHAAEQSEIVARLIAMHAAWAKDVAPK